MKTYTVHRSHLWEAEQNLELVFWHHCLCPIQSTLQVCDNHALCCQICEVVGMLGMELGCWDLHSGSPRYHFVFSASMHLIQSLSEWGVLLTPMSHTICGAWKEHKILQSRPWNRATMVVQMSLMFLCSYNTQWSASITLVGHRYMCTL